MLGLKHSGRKGFRRITRAHGNHRLRQNRPMIQGRRDQMHGGTMRESARLECAPMGMQAWKRRQQGGMNI